MCIRAFLGSLELGPVSRGDRHLGQPSLAKSAARLLVNSSKSIFGTRRSLAVVVTVAVLDVVVRAFTGARAAHR